MVVILRPCQPEVDALAHSKSRPHLHPLFLLNLYATPNTMQFKEATAADLKPWVDMRYALWGGNPDQLGSEALDILSSATDHCCLAITDSGQYVGFIEVSVRHTQSHTYGYIEGWYVDQAHRQQGVGSALIDQAEQWLLHYSVEAIFSDTDKANYHDSLPAHAHSGYLPIRYFTLLMKKSSDQGGSD